MNYLQKKRFVSQVSTKRARGFTLIELLVVVLIIATLATIAIVSAGGARLASRDAKRKSDVRSIGTAMETYITQKGPFGSTNNDRLGLSAKLFPGFCNFGHASTSWASIQNELAAYIQLPVDPINTITNDCGPSSTPFTYGVVHNSDRVEVFAFLENRSDADRHEMKKYITDEVEDCSANPNKGIKYASRQPMENISQMYFYLNTPLQCP